ncbi:DUF4377 domain-containing protein [Pseudidiomarina marina]|uniref:DUF4377 domain-containing protein n=1 Tax=Pseudidiomarina marina TaxID=502366 RepID=A0A432YG49_9GAMM|nr:DUF4377 domain-containing protein [Pseudidiomarina marina]RUO59929.1 hypothetical protein CWI76_07310 [Pseudidiomarina marina]
MKIKTIFPILMTATLMGCGGSSDSNEGTEFNVSVESAPVYYGLGIQFTPALAAIATSDSGREMFADSIVGFEHEFGTSYELRVVEKDVDTDNVADSSATSIELVEIISSEPDEIGTSYVYNEVTLEGNPFTANEETAGVYAFYQYEFLCAENVDCDGLVAIADSGGLVSVEFEYTGGEVPITLVWWN